MFMHFNVLKMLLVTEPLGLQLVPGVYWIPCSCGKVYVGQTGRTVAVREQERTCHLKKINMDKSAIIQHGWDTRHEIRFENTRVLHRSSDWHERVIKESVEISFVKKSTLNQEEGVFLSKVWLPVLALCEIVCETFKDNGTLEL